MLAKQLVCFVLIVSLMLSGCAGRGAVSASSQEGAAVAEQKSGPGAGEIIGSVLALTLLLPICLLLYGMDNQDKDKREAKPGHGRGHRR